jgi:CubicO group peptidase (beta-lactamase class C family)
MDAFGAGCLVVFAAIQGTAQTAAAPSAQPPQITVSEKVLDGYVGQYRLTPNFVITITREGDHLYAQGSRQARGEVSRPSERFELFAESATEFSGGISPGKITFITGDHGQASAIVIRAQGGSNRTAQRIVERQLTAEDLKAQCAQIDAMIAAAFVKQQAGSVTAGVVSGNQLIWTKSYGYADMDQHIAADKNTIYRIGSMTKMFTTLMLEQLVDAGKVHLADPVDKYFPQINTVQDRFASAPPVTLFELATHTSGMGREPDNTVEYRKGSVADWEKTLSAALAHTHFIFEPGTHFSYSNIGFATLGAALAHAAGESYLEYVPRHIFAPLGMTQTSFVVTAEMAPHLSRGYRMMQGKVDAETPQTYNEEGPGYNVPDGGIYTTVGDMARFASFLMGDGPDSVLNKSALDSDLTQIAIQADFQLDSGYGMGDYVWRRDTYTAFGHRGAVDPGYQAALYMNRDLRVGVILLANSTETAIDTDDLALRCLDVLSK